MNLEQFYFAKLAEESAEVAQIALKTQQFTQGEVRPCQPHSNRTRCHMELDDLFAMVEELNDKFGFDYVPNREAIAAKKLKVKHYLNYCLELGTVTEV